MTIIHKLIGVLLKPKPRKKPSPEKKASDREIIPTLAHTLEEFRDCTDLTHRSYPEIDVHLVYFSHLVDNDKLTRDVLNPLVQADFADVVKQSQYAPIVNAKELIQGILSGKVAIFFQNHAYLVDVYGPQSRPVSESETETIISGPHDAFTELAATNLSLIRSRIKSSHLKVIRLSVGEISKTDVYILYIKDIVNMEYVDELRRRIERMEIDSIHDANMLIQCIEDNPNSVFPQVVTSERPEAMASKLVAGKAIVICDGSPTVFSAPSSFFEFFSSSDDYYQRWMIGTATRILRFIAFFVTVSFTALYVSLTTYHYEMIPQDLLLTLTESRNKVPFSPIFEAFIMEVTIELLREAGARLPTKIGQTIGIVGGIVIGQAAVQAGLTSNVLIIAVASSAIASFVIPNYSMSAGIRIIRFGLILLAGIWGNFGITVGIAALTIHLSGVTSLGSSYLTPISPLKLKDWKDTFIRAPYAMLRTRPTQTKTLNKIRERKKE